PYYAGRYGFRPEDFPEAYKTFLSVISLPIYPAMSDEQTQRVIQAVLKTGDAVRKT
ncbi:MAG: DegT/DnrJ/EryC1/StrS family aminotransferase, partial [Spirochaetaceae bacterium]|nr:DegT/DnrJ/EryC1/StrS family aminotransferase [Spirochaetaceae bacterium]